MKISLPSIKEKLFKEFPSLEILELSFKDIQASLTGKSIRAILGATTPTVNILLKFKGKKAHEWGEPFFFTRLLTSKDIYEKLHEDVSTHLTY